MKHLKLMTLAVLFSVVGWTSVHAQQKAHKWDIDKAHTFVNFNIKHFVSAVTGKFTNFDGEVYFDPANLAGSSVSFTVDVMSVNTGDAGRDKHLQTPDFFDAAKFPKMTFVSSKITKKGKEYVAHGKLTIRDKTQDISIPFKVGGEVENPMAKNQLVTGIETDFKINRTTYGVGTGSWAASTVVGDDVRIQVSFELHRQK